MSQMLIYGHLVATGVLLVAVVALWFCLKLQGLTVTRSAEFRDAVRAGVSEQIHQLKGRQDSLETSQEAWRRTIESSWSDWYAKNTKLANRLHRVQKLEDDRAAAGEDGPDLSALIAGNAASIPGMPVLETADPEEAKNRQRDKIALAATRR